MSIERSKVVAMKVVTGALFLLAGCGGAGATDGTGQGGGAGASAGGGAPACDAYNTFAPGVAYATEPPNSPPYKFVESLAAADLNGDGKADLAVVSSMVLGPFGSTVSVLFNLGNGTFGAPVVVQKDGSPDAVVAADLNGDGKPDLVITSGVMSSSGYLTVLLNKGDGTFDEGAIYGVGGNPYSIVAADLNGDGKTDLAVSNRDFLGQFSSTVSVLMNQGNGTFAPTIDYDAGPYPNPIVATDLNGDGKPDLVVANSVKDRLLSVLMNQGDGTFSAPVPHGEGGSDTLAAADLNGDGKPDLVTGGLVLMNQGNGSFADGVDYGADGAIKAVTAADVNGDGLPDLVTVGKDLRVFVNHGDGTFAAADVYASGPEYSNAVAAADLNGDGVQDLALGNDDVEAWVFLATCSPEP